MHQWSRANKKGDEAMDVVDPVRPGMWPRPYRKQRSSREGWILRVNTVKKAEAGEKLRVIQLFASESKNAIQDYWAEAGELKFFLIRKIEEFNIGVGAKRSTWGGIGWWNVNADGLGALVKYSIIFWRFGKTIIIDCC